MTAVDSWNVTLRKLDDGFLVPHAELDGKQASGVSWRRIEGLAEPLSFLRIRVDVDDAPELGGEVWLIASAHKPFAGAPLESARAVLSAALPQADLSYVLEDRDRFARVLGNDRRAPVIAAAAAVMRYANAWDESPILIELGEHRFSTTVGFENKNYRVAVRRN